MDGAVFAEGAVEDGEDDVEGLGEGVGLLEDFGAGVELESLWFGLGAGVALDELLGFGGWEPLALFVDSNGDDFVLGAVDGFEDGGGGEEGDFVLAGAAAEEDTYAEFLSGVFLRHVSFKFGLVFGVGLGKKFGVARWYFFGGFGGS